MVEVCEVVVKEEVRFDAYARMVCCADGDEHE